MSARRLLIVLAALGGMLLAPAAAQAGTPAYPIEPPSSNVSEATIRAGEPVVFTGKGFQPGEPIAIDIDYGATGAAFHAGAVAPRAAFVTAALKTVTASSTGTFSTPVTLTQKGKATLTATGTISGIVVSEQVVALVARAEEPGTSEDTDTSQANLPVTGQSGGDWLTVISLGLGAILLGGLLLLGTVRLRGRRVS